VPLAPWLMNGDNLSDQLKSELVNFRGESAVPYIVRWRDSLWFCEPREPWRELLAWRLGASWLNIAEVVPAADVEDASTPQGERRGPFSKPLIRLGQTYSIDDLIVKDNDRAIAHELAFSLWIRRRDPHPWNRVYVKGVPIFFDQHVSFDQRPFDDFFNVGDDGSRPSRWRVRPFLSGEGPTTATEREFARADASEIIINRVRIVHDFERHFADAVEHIASLDAGWIAKQVEDSTAPRDIGLFLEHTRTQMPMASERLLGVLFRN